MTEEQQTDTNLVNDLLANPFGATEAPVAKPVDQPAATPQA